MAAGKKTGGRKKGTPNKVSKLGKEFLAEMLCNYSESGLMNEDFMELEPKDRLTIAEKLMQYVMPKMQSTSVDLNAASNTRTIEDMLSDLSEENPTQE